MFQAIGFDGDDTLWHGEILFAGAQERFARMLSSYGEESSIKERLFRVESKNLAAFGYGVKGFTLSMIETAVQLTEGRVSGREIQELIDMAREMLASEVRLLDRARETVSGLSRTYSLILVTKGDLLDQESKVSRSGLAGFFTRIRIVSEKSRETYAGILRESGIDPARFLMVGNSIRSDVTPVLELGGFAVHIPYALTWEHERAGAVPSDHPRFAALENLGQLPETVAKLEGSHGYRNV
jgi:putative hydrolase of the HAD superfamily